MVGWLGRDRYAGLPGRDSCGGIARIDHRNT